MATLTLTLHETQGRGNSRPLPRKLLEAARPPNACRSTIAATQGPLPTPSPNCKGPPCCAEPEDGAALRAYPKRLLYFLLGCGALAGLMLLAEQTSAQAAK